MGAFPMELQDAVTDDGEHMPGGRTRAESLFIRLASVALLAGFASYLAARYYLRPFSDPGNWWHYARNLGTEFPHSKWPVAYPAFLALVRWLAGDAAALLSNLPLLVTLVAAVGWLAQRMAENGAVSGGGRPTRSPCAAGVLAMAALVAAAGPTLLDLVSPYRDPLAFLLQIGSLLLLIRHVRSDARNRWTALASGLLLGLATAVREPSILMAAPMALYGWVTVRPRTFRAWWRSAWILGAGILLGAAPLLVQTALATQQILLPPQSVAEGHLVPGMEASLAGRTFGLATVFYRGEIWLFVLAAVGVARGVWRRQAAVVALALPLAALFAAFYTFYWIFVPRYFLFALLLLAALAGYGAEGVCAGVRRIPIIRRAAPALPLLAAIAALAWLWTGTVAAGRKERFRLAELRQFTAQLASAVPPGAIVYGARPLCDMVRFSGVADSCPVPDEDGNSGVTQSLAAGRAVFCLGVVVPGTPDAGFTLLSRTFNTVECRTLNPRELHLLEWLSDSPLTLYRVEPRTARSVTSSVPVAAGITSPVLCVAAGGPAAESDLTVDIGTYHSECRVAQGTHFIPLPSGVGGLAELRLAAGEPVGWAAPARVLSTDEPLELDFGPASPYTCDRFLSAGFERCPDLRVRRLTGEGTIRLPDVWPQDVWRCGTLVCNGFSRDGTWPVLEVAANGDALLRRAVAAERSYVSAVFWLPPGTHPELRVRVLNAGGDPQTGVLIDRLILQTLQPSSGAELDIGRDDDILWIMRGFHGREKGPGGRSVRWTAADAEVRFLLQRGERALRLAVRTCPEARPEALPAEPRFTWNGVATGAAFAEGSWQAVIRPSDVRAGENRLGITCQPWRPGAVAGGRDRRELGLMVDTITLTPMTEAP